MSESPAVLINFDFLDAVELDEADNLIRELSDIDVEAQVAEEHAPGKGLFDVAVIVAIIAVSTASAASLAVIAGFLYSVFHKGVILDLAGDRPQVYKGELPKGCLMILKKDGTTELHQGVATTRIGELMEKAIDLAKTTSA